MQLFNRVRAVTGTTGTGPMTMGAAVSGYRDFAGIPDGTTVPYTVVDGNAWEIGTGVYTAGVLTRALDESSTGALISLSGRAQVFISPRAADFVLTHNLALTGATTMDGTLSLTGSAAIGGSSSVVGEMKATYFLVPNGQGYYFGIGDGTTWLKGAGVPTPYISFGTNNTEVMRLLGANLGIGTATPIRRVEIRAPDANGLAVSNAAEAATYVLLQTSGAGTSARRGTIQAYRDSMGAIPLTLQELGGTVGIGTASPVNPLVVANGAGKGVEVIPGTNCVVQAYDRTGGAYLPMLLDCLNWGVRPGGVEKLSLSAAGNLTIGGDTVRLQASKTPATAGAAGAAGSICWDASYVYVCVATNTWKRSALTTW